MRLFRSATAIAANAITAAVLALGSQSASAATVSILQNPLPTSLTVNLNDSTRQVDSTAELKLPSFDIASDTFLIDLAAFGLAGPISFLNSLSSGLTDGINVIVLQDSDNDANPATAFNAGVAANVIASALTEDAAGFFVYFNSVLGVNRLVFSTNLNVNTADLAILARIENPTGADAIAALPGFTQRNFDAVAPVPLPAGLPLLLAALAGLGLVRRRTRT